MDPGTVIWDGFCAIYFVFRAQVLRVNIQDPEKEQELQYIINTLPNQVIMLHTGTL